MKRVILVFLKFPEAGRVKTRLASNLGNEKAARAYEQMVCRVLEQAKLARPDVIAVAYDPPLKESEIRGWLHPWLSSFSGETRWIPQSEGDLGCRIDGAVNTVFERVNESSGNALVAVIGTDCVHLESEIYHEAWDVLSSGQDVVFGPTEDGGYYLIGLNCPRPGLFREIPWSTEKTLQASLEAAGKEGLGTHLLPKRSDVDTIHEWRTVESEVDRRRCVFFDRDGVVNQSPGAGYVLSPDDFFLNEGIAEALAWLKARNWLAILVTSQKGVGKGLMTPSDLEAIHRKMQVELAERGAAFDGVYAYTGEATCAHLPKPDPEMILSACESFFIEPRQSWMIGDADRDIEMGKAAGLVGTIRIVGDKPIGIRADHTLTLTAEICSLFDKVL